MVRRIRALDMEVRTEPIPGRPRVLTCSHEQTPPDVPKPQSHGRHIHSRFWRGNRFKKPEGPHATAVSSMQLLEFPVETSLALRPLLVRCTPLAQMAVYPGGRCARRWAC